MSVSSQFLPPEKATAGRAFVKWWNDTGLSIRDCGCSWCHSINAGALIADRDKPEQSWPVSPPAHLVLISTFSSPLQILGADLISQSNYTLAVSGFIGENMVFSNTTVMEFMPKISSTFIQTDKSVYKPGQAVKIRVVSVHLDGKPSRSNVNIVIKVGVRGYREQRGMSVKVM